MRLSVKAMDSVWMKPITSAVDKHSLGGFESAVSAWQRNRSRASFNGLTRDEIVKFSQETDDPDSLRNLVMLALFYDAKYEP